MHISILALLAESDCKAERDKQAVKISILALLAESDITIMDNVIFVPRFLSSLSLRRATNDAINGCNPDIISILALLAESDRLGLLGWLRTLISILALLAESDISVCWMALNRQ